MSEFAYGGVRLVGTALYRKARIKSRGRLPSTGRLLSRCHTAVTPPDRRGEQRRPLGVTSIPFPATNRLTLLKVSLSFAVGHPLPTADAHL